MERFRPPRAFILGFVSFMVMPIAAFAQHAPVVTADQALERLMEGNKRFVAHGTKGPHRDAARLHELEAGQHPIAVVLSCADSRVSPELAFDQGLGDLFVIRVAGNVAGDPEIGSIEYEVEHLGTRLVVVMGHQSCGAVQAAMGGGESGNHIHAFVDPIMPLVAEAKKSPGDPVETCVRLNVARVVEELKTAKPILAESVRKAEIRIVGAYYNLHSGAVTLVP